MKGQEQVCLKSEEVSSQKKYYRYCYKELHDIELWTGNNNVAHDKLQKIKENNDGYLDNSNISQLFKTNYCLE